jgi:hypothetical protein
MLRFEALGQRGLVELRIMARAGDRAAGTRSATAAAAMPPRSTISVSSPTEPASSARTNAISCASKPFEMPGRALDVIGPPAYRCRVVAGFPKCVRRIFSGVRIGDEGDRSDMGGGYPAYDVAQSRKGNPLWNQLVKKASQLAGP